VIQKALILSAGQGKRLLPYTEDCPKCLLPFNGRTVLEWQIASLSANGVREITVITGFHAEAIDAVLAARPEDGVRVQTRFNPFFEVADNLGSCYIGREAMLDGPFVLVNGDTLFHPDLMKRAMLQLSGDITVTIDRKPRYDDDDMKVSCADGRLITIGKHLTPDVANAESIGMLYFSAKGGEIFARAVKTALHDPAGLKRWYLSVIDSLAAEHEVRVAEIAGQAWCELDFPMDMAAAGELTAQLRREASLRDGHGARLREAM
jgi:choline kinase